MSLILKTLTGEPLKASQGPGKRDEGLKGLSKGRTLKATVLGPDPDGGIRVRLMGTTVLAESQAALKPGQSLTLTVEQTEPELVFSLEGREAKPHLNRLNLALQEAMQGRERLLRSLNALLAREEPAGSPDQKVPEAAARLKQAINNAGLDAKRAADPEAIPRLVRQTGLDLESRLAHAARRPADEARILFNPVPARTVRGLAKLLVQQLGAGLADAPELESRALKAMQDLLASAQGLNSALDAAAKLNAELLPQKDMLYLPLPLLFNDQVLGGELLLQLPGHDEAGERDGKTKLVFLLEMSALGPVAVEALLGPQRISGSIIVSDAPKAEFIAPRLEELQEALRQAGFKAEFSVRSRTAGEAWDSSPLADIILDSGHSFSITV